MVLCVLKCRFIIQGCASLKEKRSQVKPLLNRLQREFRVSAAEIDLQDVHDQAVIACALVSSDRIFTEKSMQHVIAFIESYWKNLELVDHHIEFY
jgi:uncharacterized protein YlxP (DUF503 family)